MCDIVTPFSGMHEKRVVLWSCEKSADSVKTHAKCVRVDRSALERY